MVAAVRIEWRILFEYGLIDSSKHANFPVIQGLDIYILQSSIRRDQVDYFSGHKKMMLALLADRAVSSLKTSVAHAPIRAQQIAEPPQSAAATSARRHLLLAAAALLAAPPPSVLAATSSSRQTTAASIERQAMQAYAGEDFASAVKSIGNLVDAEPTDPRWREMRAQALVDSKDFPAAIRDFDVALKLVGDRAGGGGANLDTARLLAGRGLAYEGIGDWVAALKDYSEALDMARDLGQDPDPYVVNSRGNCHASLGE
jgi:tetratricopeptide (TPR) repeat protein